MDTAERLEVQGLAQFCKGFIRSVLRPSTCCTLLGQALHFKMEELATTELLPYSQARFVAIKLRRGVPG